MYEDLRRKLVALSRIINETSDKVDEFQGMCFAADSHYPEGQKSLFGPGREEYLELLDSFDDINDVVAKMIRGNATPDDIEGIRPNIDNYTQNYAGQTLRATVKPPNAVTNQVREVELPEIDFSAVDEYLESQGRYSTTTGVVFLK